MKTRRQHVAEDALTISRRRTRSSTSMDNSFTIPIDLIVEIFLRLPAKSIATCRCVCKFWASMLRRTDFTELFLTMSPARPQILFSGWKDGELFFFSAPQVRNSDLTTATYHMKLPCDDRSSKFIGPVGGLVCLTHGRKYKRTAAMICNPSTGQSLALPNVKTRSVRVYSVFGFDPIDKQLKLLSMTSTIHGNCKEHQVLTLGSRKLSWRTVECSISHIYLGNDGICINGVLYYEVQFDDPLMLGIVCFDVRSEKFSSIKRADSEDMLLWGRSTLVKFKGKLGIVLSERYFEDDNGSFELWVLVDAEKHEWSKHLYVVEHPLLKNLFDERMLHFVGVTGEDEIVLSSYYVSHSFFVYYYNMDSKTVIRVEIQGMNAIQSYTVHTYLDHVEDVKLMQYGQRRKRSG